MTIIRLVYKQPKYTIKIKQRGNFGHAGRPNQVGGSMPRNYGAALSARNSLASRTGSISGARAIWGIDMTKLNKQGLQAIIDHDAGKITRAQMDHVLSLSSSARYNNPLSPTAMTQQLSIATSNAAAATARAQQAATQSTVPKSAATPAPVSSAHSPGSLLAQAQAAHDLLKSKISSPAQDKLLNNLDLSKLNDRGLQAVIDHANGKTSFMNLFNTLKSPKSQGTPSATATSVPTSLTQTIATAVAAIPATSMPSPTPAAGAVAPAPATPAPATNSKYFQGNILKASPDDLFKGSSKEVQDLAKRTGMIATDDASFEYIKTVAQRDPSIVKGASNDIVYIKDYEKGIKTYNNQVENRMRNTFTSTGSMQLGNLWSSDVYNSPMYNLGSRLKKLDVDADPHWSDDDKTLIKKALDANDEIMHDTHSARLGTATTFWNNLGDSDRSRLLDISAAHMRAEWINNNVPNTMYDSKGYKRSLSQYNNIHPSMVNGGISDNAARDVKAAGYEWRGTMMKRQTTPQSGTVGGYDTKEMSGLSTLSKKEEDGYRTWIAQGWDTTRQSGEITIHGMYRVISQPGVKSDYDSRVVTKDNEFRNGFHATSYTAAHNIATTGFLPRPASVGRMLGDGLYVAEHAAKSALYVGAQYSAQVGTHGVMFIVNTARGTTKSSNDMNSVYDSGPDTVVGGSGAFVTGPRGGRLWLNDEMAVRDVRAVWPKVWMDVEVKSRMSFI